MMRSISRLIGAVWWLLFSVSVQAVDFTLPDLQGKDRTLAEFRGQWLLVNFWATWCPPCIEEMPELERFYLDHKDRDARVIGINMEDIPLQRLKEFVEEAFISYPILLAPADGYTPLGPIPALPTSILISPQGDVVARHVGGMTAVMIERLLKQAEQSQKPALADSENGRRVH
ncbi:TlpA disulfide reductase family protein [Sedimenticola sp.]|uniref:TlpA disulfide reductase family protein n=1 Tax=Sedimenticola sp. TaxID=1940285 RepID=UPI003D0D6F44